MGLRDVLSLSRNSLHVASDQLSIVSRNIAGANDPNYVHRTSQLHSYEGGGVYGSLQRDGNPILLANYLANYSLANGYQTLFQGMSRLNVIYSANEFANSPRQLLSEFKRSLQRYANDPSHATTGDAAILEAQRLVNSLHRGSEAINNLREEADRDIKASVDKINSLLTQLGEVEKSLLAVRNNDQTAFSYMDKRDAILKELSAEITITVHHNNDGSISLYGANGVTLFDRAPRKVSFAASIPLKAGQKAHAVYVDGVPLDHDTFVDPNGGGHLGNLLKLRDEIAPRYQKQLDNIAKALIDIFQHGEDGKILEKQLFIVKDGAKGEKGQFKLDGLAGSIMVNKDFVVEQNGKAANLGSGKQVQKFIDAFGAIRDFSSDSGINHRQSLIEFTAESLSWMSAHYQEVNKRAQYHNAMCHHAEQSLSNATGVNRDDELALMLSIEQSYGASAKLVQAVSKMMDDLLAAVH